MSAWCPARAALLPSVLRRATFWTLHRGARPSLRSEERRVGKECRCMSWNRALRVTEYWYDRSVRIDLFFFQAEDGIRDTSVTGVQTCALPILKIFGPDLKEISRLGQEIEKHVGMVSGTRSAFAERVAEGYFLDFTPRREAIAQIGRASCRERM